VVPAKWDWASDPSAAPARRVVTAGAQVALLAGIDDAVAAVAAVAAVGPALLVAAVAAGRACVALLGAFHHAVAANGGRRFQQADLGATVARHPVAVIAGFESHHPAVAAYRNAGAAGNGATPADLDHLAVEAAAGIRLGVVAGFGDREHPVKANGDAGTGAARAACERALLLTELAAPVPGDPVAVVALLAGIDDAVAAEVADEIIARVDATVEMLAGRGGAAPDRDRDQSERVALH